jgi:predicted transcriptional regulator
MIFGQQKSRNLYPFASQEFYVRGLTNMRRSKMEMYVDILKVLAQNGPLKLTHIMYKANVNCKVLKQNLDFLINQNLIEKQTKRKKRNKVKVRYVITERGKTVIKYFNKVTRALQITNEMSIPALIR